MNLLTRLGKEGPAIESVNPYNRRLGAYFEYATTMDHWFQSHQNPRQ